MSRELVKKMRALLVTKRFVKMCASLIFFACTSIWELCWCRIGGSRAGRCVVLLYHGIQSEERSKFAQQMDMVARLTTPISAASRVTLCPGVRYSALTFDDGFSNVLSNAVPEIVCRRIPATIFVVSDVLGGWPTWDTAGEDHIQPEPLISAAQLRELPSDLITIGSHTISHPRLPSVTVGEAKEQISRSRERLTALLNRDVDLFSFPFGEFNNQLVQSCREAGYSRVFTIIPRLAFGDPQELVTGRIEVSPNDWAIEFRLKLLGAYRWLPPIFALKRRARTFFHRCTNSLIGQLEDRRHHAEQ